MIAASFIDTFAAQYRARYYYYYAQPLPITCALRVTPPCLRHLPTPSIDTHPSALCSLPDPQVYLHSCQLRHSLDGFLEPLGRRAWYSHLRVNPLRCNVDAPAHAQRCPRRLLVARRKRRRIEQSTTETKQNGHFEPRRGGRRCLC